MANSGLRDLKKEASWRQVILAHAGSAMSVRAWCRDQQVNEAGFYWWRRQLARRDAESSSAVGHDKLDGQRHDSQATRLSNNQPSHPNLRNFGEDAPEDIHQDIGKTTAKSPGRRSRLVTTTARPTKRRNRGVKSADQLPQARREASLTLRRTRRSAPSPVFVPVRVAEDDPDERSNRIAIADGSGLIEIVLTDGRCVRITGSVDQRNLADVLTVLEHAAPGQAVMERASSERGSC
ncbi:MAG: hypothetical protein IIA33_09000 [Planctomycetes bacterium]|nr:hypothetical protein [Planctomycetota bacterium]